MMGNGLFTKINIFRRNILLAFIAFLMVKLTQAILLVGIVLRETQQELAGTQVTTQMMLEIMKAMAKKLRISL